MSRLVAETLRDRRWNVREVTYEIDHRRSGTAAQLAKIGHLAPYAVAHPWRALSDTLRIVATRQASARDLAKSIFNWTFISSLAARGRAKHDVLILDQGVAQAIWSVGFAARRNRWLDLLATTPPSARPDLVIHVRADLPEVGARLARRPTRASRMDRCGDDCQALQRAAEHTGAILARLRAADVAVVEVDNSDNAQLVRGARVVADAIEARLREPSARMRAQPHGPPRPRPPLRASPSEARDEECRP